MFYYVLAIVIFIVLEMVAVIILAVIIIIFSSDHLEVFVRQLVFKTVQNNILFWWHCMHSKKNL